MLTLPRALGVFLFIGSGAGVIADPSPMEGFKAHMRSGELLFAECEPASAMAEYDQAVALIASHPAELAKVSFISNAHLYRAITALAKGDSDAALTSSAEILKVRDAKSPSGRSAIGLRDQAYLQKGDFESAAASANPWYKTFVELWTTAPERGVAECKRITQAAECGALRLAAGDTAGALIDVVASMTYSIVSPCRFKQRTALP